MLKMSVPIEFAVQMTCQSCVDKIEKKLKTLAGVENIYVNLDQGSVVVETTLPSFVIQENIEATGRIAVLKGLGRSNLDYKRDQNVAAVAMLGGSTGYSRAGVRGVVRMVQADESTCIIEGTLDGLNPGLHGLHIHEFGDISKGCESVGDHFSLIDSPHGAPSDLPNARHTGDLGNVNANSDGRAVFRFTDKILNVNDVIGRSVVVTENPDDLGKGSEPLSIINGNSGCRLACGIISRSAGLFENAKKICACDGVTLWDERDKPLVGPGRSSL